MALSVFIAPVATTARNLVGPGTTLLKAGTGILRRVVINAAGTTAVIYDNVTGTGPTIATLNLGANFPVSVQYDVPFLTGLTMVTTGGAVNLTVVYE